MYKLRFKFIGLSKVDWDDYDFHITPVLTYSNVNYKNSNGKAIAIEWGHWAIYIGILKVSID